MKEIVGDISAWKMEGRDTFAIATVLRTWGSAPRRPGAKMAIDSDGNVTGSVSGGCVEGAVIRAARDCLETGEVQLLHFGVADESAWDVGLACGGSIDILVEKLDLAAFDLVCQMIDEEQSGSIVTIVRGPEALVGQKTIVNGEGESTGSMTPEFQERVQDLAADVRQTGLIKLDAEMDVFVDLVQPAPMLVAVGGGDIAITLTKMARLLGYDVTVIDPRSVFGSEVRFPHVDRLIQKWPRSAFSEIELTPNTAVALLTHDPKIDDPSLNILLESDVFYIGALGSRKTHAKRLRRLAKMGFTAGQIDRICAPIGLDIGAANPGEIALAVMAEIVSVRRGMNAAEQI